MLAGMDQSFANTAALKLVRDNSGFDELGAGPTTVRTWQATYSTSMLSRQATPFMAFFVSKTISACLCTSS